MSPSIEPVGYIYLVQNSVNTKIYVGQTTRTVAQRWKEHITDSKFNDFHINRAIKKYRSNKFTVQVLAECFSQEELNNLEKVWVVTLRSYDPKYGYNMTFGGNNGKWPNYRKENHSRLFKEITKGKNMCRTNWTPEKRRQLGRSVSELLRKKREAGIKRKPSSESYRKNQSAFFSNLIWVTNGVQNKRIPRDFSIPQGWSKGKKVSKEHQYSAL